MPAETNTGAYSSFSGIDIIAVVADVVIATLQGVSYSVTREKAPIYTFGSANPRSFSRGKRGLAGSMIFTLFDRSALYQVIRDPAGRWNYYAHESEPNTIDTNKGVWEWANEYTQQIQANGTINTVHRHAEYADQIMPFNITLIAQNEYGLTAWMSIVGIEILNEGGGLSVDDITNEEQMTYVARAKTAWVPWIRNADPADPNTGRFYTGLVDLRPGESSVNALVGEAGNRLVEQYKNWMSINNNQNNTQPTNP